MTTSKIYIIRECHQDALGYLLGFLLEELARALNS